MADATECPICLGVLNNGNYVKICPRGHQTCVTCYRTIMNGDRTPKCPFDRGPLIPLNPENAAVLRSQASPVPVLSPTTMKMMMNEQIVLARDLETQFAVGKVFAGLGDVRWTQTTNNFLPETHYNVAQIIASAQGPVSVQHGSTPW
jgi:hypothetical protein